MEVPDCEAAGRDERRLDERMHEMAIGDQPPPQAGVLSKGRLKPQAAQSPSEARLHQVQQPQRDNQSGSTVLEDRDILDELLGGHLVAYPTEQPAVQQTEPQQQQLQLQWQQQQQQQQVQWQQPQQQWPIQMPNQLQQPQQRHPCNPVIRQRLRNRLSSRQMESQQTNGDFSSRLHVAVTQNAREENVKEMLEQLKASRILICFINSVNKFGHTPLSLSLKHGRADLVRLFVSYDAIPSQLVCEPSERTNHFHYAFKKCTESPQQLEGVWSLLEATARYCSNVLDALHAKNRNDITPIWLLQRQIERAQQQQQQHGDPGVRENFANSLARLQRMLEFAERWNGHANF